MKTILQFTIIVLGLVVFSRNILAQPNNHKIHSIFIYNFAKYIQWPSNDKTNDFTIEILGKSPLADELERIVANKVVGTRRITIRRVNAPDQISASHIVIIPSNESKHFEELQARLKGKPTLLITEKPGLGKKGSGINFIIKDNKWCYELNEASINQNGLRVSTEITKFALNI